MLSLSLTLLLSLSLSHSFALSLSLSHTHTHTHNLLLFFSFSLSCSLSLSHSLTGSTFVTRTLPDRSDAKITDLPEKVGTETFIFFNRSISARVVSWLLIVDVGVSVGVSIGVGVNFDFLLKLMFEKARTIFSSFLNIYNFYTEKDC